MTYAFGTMADDHAAATAGADDTDTMWEEYSGDDALYDEQTAVAEVLAPLTGYLRRPMREPL
jgi:hypothetical protein